MQRIVITKQKIELYENGVFKGSGAVDGKIRPVLEEVIKETTPTARDEKRDKYIATVNKICKLFKATKVTVLPYEPNDTCVR